MSNTKTTATFSLAQLADKLAVPFRGDANITVSAIAPIESARNGELTFLHHHSYCKYLTCTQASIVIMSEQDALQYSGAVLISSDPYRTYAQAAQFFASKEIPIRGIHPTVIIGKGCHIDESVGIAPYVVIGDHVTIEGGVQIGAGSIIGNQVTIGEESYLFPRTTLYSRVKIGKRLRLHSGVVIGSDGFGLSKVEGEWQRIPQLGCVILADDVDVGANTTIDRGALGDTVIAKGVKLDNQIQIGHNVHIGEHTVIAGCVGIAGSTKVGKHCMIGGGSCIAGHISIADHVVITGMSQVTKSISKVGIYSSGTSVQTNADWHKSVARFKQLDKMARRINALKLRLRN